MRVSKLEPHVLGGPPSEDVDLFMSDISEQSQDVEATQEVTDHPLENGDLGDGEVKEGFVRLADFLKKKMANKAAFNKKPRSKLAVALRAYHKQLDSTGPARADPMGDHDSLENETINSETEFKYNYIA